jgi:hypothetical protein
VRTIFAATVLLLQNAPSFKCPAQNNRTTGMVPYQMQSFLDHIRFGLRIEPTGPAGGQGGFSIADHDGRGAKRGKVGGCLPGRGHCSAGDPIAGLLSRGREWDLPGSQAVHPVPLPQSRTPAESTIARLFVGLVNAAPASRTAKEKVPLRPPLARPPSTRGEPPPAALPAGPRESGA